MRRPSCEGCPLAAQPKVYGIGPLDAEVLLVDEAPGGADEKEGEPLQGMSGKLINVLLKQEGLTRGEVRVEYAYQCKARYGSADAARALEHCGPSLQQVIDAMPNLKVVVAFGEAALQEASGRRESELARKQAEQAIKKERKQFESALRKHGRTLESLAKKRVKWGERVMKAAAKGKVPKGTPPPEDPPLPVPPPVRTLPAVIGWDTISAMRGSPLALPRRRGVWLVPTVHPSATLPFRSPRLRPLMALDFKKAVAFGRGVRTVPPTPFIVAKDAGTLEKFFGRISRAGGPAPIALDIEWSRVAGELVCVGIGGPGDAYCIIPFRTRDGWTMLPLARQDMMRTLQEGLDDPTLEWGGHFAVGYDERKLASVGLRLRCKWDTLYAFHLLFAEFGSSRDESAVREGQFSQATGYDLGFISSVLTDFPYHKGVVTYSRDALDADTTELWTYCVGDVARTYHSWIALRREMEEAFRPVSKGLVLLEDDMECARRAAQMTLDGVPIIEGERRKRESEWLAKAKAGVDEAVTLVGKPDFNINSPHQLARELEARGIAVKRDRTTNNPMLDAKQVERLIEKHPGEPLLQLVSKVREAIKEAGAYENMEPTRDGCAHPSWKIHGTVGPRWSSSPNFQNLSHEQREVVG